MLKKKKKSTYLEFCSQQNSSSKVKGIYRIFQNKKKKKLRDYSANNLDLQEMLKTFFRKKKNSIGQKQNCMKNGSAAIENKHSEGKEKLFMFLIYVYRYVWLCFYVCCKL